MIAEHVLPWQTFVEEHDSNDQMWRMRQALGSGETIHVAGEGPRCYPCFNRETADRLNIDFEEPPFQPIVLKDSDGAPHTFTFRSMLVLRTRG